MVAKLKSLETPDDKILVDAVVASKLLSVSTKHLMVLAKRGAIPSMKLGRCRRFSPKQLAEWATQATAYSSGEPPGGF